MPRRPPAVESPSIKLSMAWTKRREVFRDVLGLEHRGGHYNFEDRSRSKLPLDGPIQHGSARVRVKRGPFRVGNSNCEIIGIERGPADHRQDFSCAWIHGDDGAFFVSHIAIRDSLQVVVDGQTDGLAGGS